MGQAGIRGRAGTAPGRTPRAARVPGLLRVAAVAGLAFAGWFVLAALAGSASADTGEARPAADGTGTAGMTGTAVSRAGELASAALRTVPAKPREARPAREAGTHGKQEAREAHKGREARGAGESRRALTPMTAHGDRLLRAPSAAVGRLVAGVPELRELRPAASGLVGRAGLADRHPVRDLLSPLAGRLVPEALLDGPGDRPHDVRDSVRKAPSPGAEAAPAEDARTATGATGGCRDCGSADAPAAPRHAPATGEDDGGTGLPQNGGGHTPPAGLVSSSTLAAPPAVAVRALPAAVAGHDASPADPAFVPD
ncbi:hypothetical protein [Spirillospora sp. NPDC029432]|uniref:hypothetical protein n=1 Tax=Spirillospora sp. NPDC029432 TaxID=3154599 RepID=UPI0034556E31